MSVAPSHPTSTTTTPNPRTRIGVLAGREKGEPGLALPASQPDSDPFDPLNPDAPGSRPSFPRVRGVDQKFSALIKNTGSKTIATVHWAYFFVPQDGQEAFAYVFTTKIDIPPGKEKTLRDQLQSIVLPANKSKAPSAHNRALFKERVVILRLEYADGTSWRSSGSNSRQ